MDILTSTNYDEIANSYVKSKTNPAKLYSEEHTFFQVLNDVRGRSVLDLACGDGYYARIIKRIGARSVTGADISEGMIALAKQKERTQQLGINYLVRDVIKTEAIGKFDIVTAVYLLPHAQTIGELQAMCDAIYYHLKPSGRLVAVTIDPKLSVDRQPLLEKYGFRIEATPPLLDGNSLVVTLISPDGPLHIKDHYWSKDTYEKCLKNAGFQSTSWHMMRVSPEGLEKFGKNYWQQFIDNPGIAILEALK